MLTNENVFKLIDNQEIEIGVSFEKKDDKFIELEQEQCILSTSLKDNLYSDRLKITIGPIIKILNSKKVNTKNRFKNDSNCIDLRKCNNKYIIAPGESIIVLTNERIKLDGKHACLILPRISMADVGVVVTPAYVDPFYNGIMRLHLVNQSDKLYELTFLEPIAQCFFFELSEVVSSTFKEQFSTKSVFFGQTWAEIFKSDRSPFPTKKKSVNSNRISNFYYQLKLIWNFIKKHSLIFLIIANFFVIASSFVVFKHNFETYTSTLAKIEKNWEPIASEIIIQAGESQGAKEIIVEYPKNDIITVLCNNNDVKYKILSGDLDNTTKIIFTANLSSATINEYEINFLYVIIRRI